MIERHPISAPLHGIGWPALGAFALSGPVGGIIVTIAAAAIFLLVAAGRL